MKPLQDQGVHIWDEWAGEDGDLGPLYGKQWRSWFTSHDPGNGIDQIAEVINEIKTNPESRRLIVSTWNVAEIEDMALPPCHILFQFYVRGGFLDCQLYQRSGDMFLGVPYNIASYALLTSMIAQVCELRPGVLTHVLGDAHVYSNHFEQVQTQLARKAMQSPMLDLNPHRMDIDEFTMGDIGLGGYFPQPAIKAPVAV